MDQYTTVIALANAATLVAGGLIAVLAYRAFCRTRSPSLRALAAGFGLVAAGSILGGLLYVVGEEPVLGATVQSSFTALGFLAFCYSLYVDGAAATVANHRIG